MKLRTQLALAFFLLAVLPLTGIVLYSYHSSREALRQAAAAESERLAAEMRLRLSSDRAQLTRHIARLGSVPANFWEPATEGLAEKERLELEERTRFLLGDAAPLVRTIELLPEPPAPPNPQDPPASGQVIAPSAAPNPNPKPLVIAIGENAARLAHRGAEVGLRAFLEGLEEPSPEAVQEIEAQAELFHESVVQGLPELLEAVGAPSAVVLEAVEQATEIEAQQQLAEDEFGPVLPEGLEFAIELPEMQGSMRGQALVRGADLLLSVLASTARQQGEIPFAVDADGTVYVQEEEDRPRLAGLLPELPVPEARRDRDQWVVARALDSESGLELGIARPIDRTLEGVERAAVRNFLIGLALIGLALVGFLPLSKRLTQDLAQLTEGAHRIAQGDLATRVEAHSRNEMGHLAGAFNHMAEDLARQRRQLVEEERQRREQELDRRLLLAEHQRKTSELEEARRFQLSLLPQELPDHPEVDLAVCMRTATEVGGDYYDFDVDPDGTFVAVIGDATGHGARAGTMVTAVKSLFAARQPGTPPSAFLTEVTRALRRMRLGRMAMALTLVEIREHRLCVATAGMPPVLLHRRQQGDVRELGLPALPLGTRMESDYGEHNAVLEPGDTLLLATDGFPELQGEKGNLLGYEQMRKLFAEAAGQAPQAVVDHLSQAADAWTGGGAPADDMTFVVLSRRTS